MVRGVCLASHWHTARKGESMGCNSSHQNRQWQTSKLGPTPSTINWHWQLPLAVAEVIWSKRLALPLSCPCLVDVPTNKHDTVERRAGLQPFLVNGLWLSRPTALKLGGTYVQGVQPKWTFPAPTYFSYTWSNPEILWRGKSHDLLV